MLECVTAIHEVATGGLPAALQAELDVYTVTMVGAAARSAHFAVGTEPRIHTAVAAAAVLRAATACAAALCAAGHRRGPRWHVPPELVLFLRAPAADAAQGALQERALCLARAATARVADEAAARVPVDEDDAAHVSDVAAKVRTVMQVWRPAGTGRAEDAGCGEAVCGGSVSEGSPDLSKAGSRAVACFCEG